MGILITRQKMWQRFLVQATLIVALTEALPQGKVFYVPSRPFYFKGKRCDNVKWSNDEILAEMGRPLNPPCGYPGRPVAPETNERKRRSADPEPEPQSYGGEGRWYTKGQLGENVRWSNDQQLIDAGRVPNSPEWIAAGQKVRRSADPNPADTGRWYTKGKLGEKPKVTWSNDQHLIDMGRTPNPPGWIIEYMNNNGQEERQERKGKKDRKGKNLH